MLKLVMSSLFHIKINLHFKAPQMWQGTWIYALETTNHGFSKWCILSSITLAQNYNLYEEIWNGQSNSILNHVTIKQTTVESVSVVSWSYVHNNSFTF